MTGAITIDIAALPPSTNRLRSWSRGGGFSPQKAKAIRERDEFRALLYWRFRQAYPGRKPIAGPVAVEIDWWPARRGSDIDNREKSLLDALTWARVWIDDKQVRHKTTELHDPAADRRPRVRVTVREIERPVPTAAVESAADGGF